MFRLWSLAVAALISIVVVTNSSFVLPDEQALNESMVTSHDRVVKRVTESKSGSPSINSFWWHPHGRNLEKASYPPNKAHLSGNDWVHVKDTPNWGLGVISHSERDTYTYRDPAGKGIYIYVLDGGIDISHEDFGGRAKRGFDSTTKYVKGETQFQNLRHGTHVASIAAGEVFGVAKKATIIDVKLRRNPDEDTFHRTDLAIEEGIRWAIDDIKKNSRLGKAVLNLSWTIDTSLSEEPCKNIIEMMKELYYLDVPVVMCAGNQDMSAMTRCPQMSGYGMVVGSVDRFGRRAPSSNWGPQVDIYAPGVDIRAAKSFTYRLSMIDSGTSMAAPFVSGVIALMLAELAELGFHKVKVDYIYNSIIWSSIADQVDDTRGSANRLLYNGGRDGFDWFPRYKPAPKWRPTDE